MMDQNLQNTEGSLKPSPTRVRRSTRKTDKPITAAEAAGILQSALRYCRKAGLTVQGTTEEGVLELRIEGLVYKNGEILVSTGEQSDTKSETVTP